MMRILICALLLAALGGCVVVPVPVFGYGHHGYGYGGGGWR
ncbi:MULTISPECIES: hypothetical protein [Silvimonas]|nr:MULTISPECIES: hypothetical protein [Silvimonas]MDR3427293.1 hypothetical protein [Silvimonas sp.]